MDRICQVRPDVIIIEKDISRSVLMRMKDLNITVITNVNKTSIEKIARCTETLIIPSVNLIEKRTVLGSCKKFYMKQGSTKRINKNSKIMTYTQSLIYIDGCKPWYGSTICLSGPNQNYLKVIGKYLRVTLKYCRDLVLEREYLFVSDADSHDKESSPFLISKVGVENFSLQYVKAIIKRKKVYGNLSQEENGDIDENEDSNEEERIGVSESQVRKKMDNMCGKPVKELVEFYGQNDMTLGSFLRQIVNEAYEK